MDAKVFDEQFRQRVLNLSTTNLSDAMDKIGINGAVSGIRPMYECPPIVGRAVTIKIMAAGMKKSEHHLGVHAIDASCEGDVILIDNHGDVRNNCWGEILSMGAKMKGVSGVIVDGAAQGYRYVQRFRISGLRARDGSHYCPGTDYAGILQHGYSHWRRSGETR